jgi:hypothetical protein
LIVRTHLGCCHPPQNLHRRPRSSSHSLHTGELLVSTAVVAPSFARGRMVRGWRALIVRTHLGCRHPCPPRTLPAEASPLPPFLCASGVVRACLSSSRLRTHVGGGVLLRIFGLCRIDRKSHLRCGCCTKTTPSAELFALHAFYTQSRSP